MTFSTCRKQNLLGSTSKMCQAQSRGRPQWNEQQLQMFLGNFPQYWPLEHLASLTIETRYSGVLGAFAFHDLHRNLQPNKHDNKMWLCWSRRFTWPLLTLTFGLSFSLSFFSLRSLLFTHFGVTKAVICLWDLISWTRRNMYVFHLKLILGCFSAFYGQRLVAVPGVLEYAYLLISYIEC